MGLTIVNNFIERMGGKMGLNTVLDQGTTVWFEFPIE